MSLLINHSLLRDVSFLTVTFQPSLPELAKLFKNVSNLEMDEGC